MMRQLMLAKCFACLLAVAAVFVLPSRSQAQAKNPLFKELDTYVATDNFQGGNLTLKEFLGKLYIIIDKKGRKLPIVLDVDAFKTENPEIDESLLYDVPVKFQPFPPEMTIDMALRTAIAKIPTKNATYVVLPDHILITTVERTSAEVKLNEKVRGTFDKRTLNSVVAELSHKVGATIIIDNRCGDKAETKITATFMNDVPLAGALRILTEMADLKVVVLDGAIMVTTPAHADTLRKEQQKKEKDYEELRLLKE
ncbi:MAG TPA: hypothetical protein VE988_29020, partial [Gemmataceae bacterium]|nr:hypothetical protein [Gemmataceae bacterium]